MFGFREPRRAQIPSDVRDTLEGIGEGVIGLAMVARESMLQIEAGPAFDLRGHTRHVWPWLRERRDIAANKEMRMELIEWAIVIFVGLEVIHDFAIYAVMLVNWLRVLI